MLLGRARYANIHERQVEGLNLSHLQTVSGQPRQVLYDVIR